jgi:hypothetical protein
MRNLGLMTVVIEGPRIASLERVTGGYARTVNWELRAARAEARYADGERRLPAEADLRQKQLVRMGMAAGAAGLAHLMAGRRDDARTWLLRSADRHRESWADAPSDSWGRPIGALKARILAGDRAGAREDARWTLALGAAEGSAIGRYAATLAALVLDDRRLARELSASLQAEEPETFPRPVADALAGLAAGDAAAYAEAARAVLASFEERDAYLEDLPAADTVAVLERLAAERCIAAGLTSPLLPAQH